MSDPLSRDAVAVLSANTGEIDPWWPVPRTSLTDQWFMAVDSDGAARRARAHGWTPLRLESDLPPQLASRLPKTRPDLHVPASVTLSVWIDARFHLVSDRALVQAIEALGERALALYAHPWRRTITEEVAECRRRRLVDARAEEQAAAYAQETPLPDLGLWAGGLIARRHSPETQAFGEIWLAEILRWRTRDQLSLPYALRRSGIVPVVLPGSVYEMPDAAVLRHRRSWLVRLMRRG